MASLYDYGVPNAVNSMVNLLDVVSQDKARKEQANHNRILQQKAMFEMDRQRKQEEMLDKDVAFTGMLEAQGASPRVIQRTLKYLQGSGLGDEIGRIKVRNIPTAISMFKGDTNYQIGVLHDHLDDIGEQELALEDEITKMKEKPDPEKQQELAQKIMQRESLKAKKLSYNNMLGKLTGVKTDTSVTEAEILTLPDDDPRKMRYLAGKKQLSESGGSPKISYDDQLIINDFVEKNKRIPTAGEVLKAKSDRQLTLANGGMPPIQQVEAVPSGNRETDKDLALQGIDPATASMVKNLAEYKIPLPSGFGITKPYWQNIMSRAQLLNPAFDATQYNVRLKLRNDFTSGNAAKNIRSLNTAIQHLDTLAKKGKELNNSSLQWWNKVANYGLTKMGDKRVTEFENAATAVAGEAANVFKNTTGTDQEIKAWRQNISDVQSPEQIQGNIDTVIELLGGRLAALTSQYEQGMGQPKDFTMLSQKSRNILTDLGVDVDKIDPTLNVESKKQPPIPGAQWSEKYQGWYIKQGGKWNKVE